MIIFKIVTLVFIKWLDLFAFQGHIYNSTSRIKNRKEKKSWLGYAQVGEYLKHAPHPPSLMINLSRPWLRVNLRGYCIVVLTSVVKTRFLVLTFKLWKLRNIQWGWHIETCNEKFHWCCHSRLSHNMMV